MKPKIYRFWLLLSLFVVPLAGGVNALVFPTLVGRRADDAWLSMPQLLGWSSLTLAFSVPLGILSLALNLGWHAGKLRQTRLGSECLGIISCALLLWIFDNVKVELGSNSFYALAPIPVLWSLCLLLFALFARPFQKDEL